MEVFAYVKSQVCISEACKDYITDFELAGAYLKGTCPFCKEIEEGKTLTVSLPKQIFYCFKCHLGGDVTSFVARIKEISPRDAINYLVQKYDIAIDKELLKEATTIKRPYLLGCEFQTFKEQFDIKEKLFIKKMKETDLSNDKDCELHHSLFNNLRELIFLDMFVMKRYKQAKSNMELIHALFAGSRPYYGDSSNSLENAYSYFLKWEE